MLNWCFENVYDVTHPFRSVYLKALYDLLKERLGDDTVNISHEKMPSWQQHVDFVCNEPYLYHDMIVNDEDPKQVLGTLYVTHDNEIGIFIFKVHQGKGYAREAVTAILDAYPCEEFYANVNPKNTKSIEFFERLGFRLIQQTYKLNARVKSELWDDDA
jgi:RimJ/RimL family protein N-acetyltransferase